MLAIRPVDISLAGMLAINNVCGLIPVAAAAWYWGEVELWPSLLETASVADYVIVLSSCVLGLAVGWSIILVQQRLTATSMQMLSNMNRLAIIAGGVFIIGETYTLPAFAGLILAFGGGSWFAVARTTAAVAEADAQKSKSSTMSESSSDSSDSPTANHSRWFGARKSSTAVHANGFENGLGHGPTGGNSNGNGKADAIKKIAGTALSNGMPTMPTAASFASLISPAGCLERSRSKNDLIVERTRSTKTDLGMERSQSKTELV